MKNTIFNFDYFFVYIAGSIQYVPNYGKEWRKPVKKYMTDTIGIPAKNIFDPTDKPITSFYGEDFDIDTAYIDKLRDVGDWDEIERISKNIIRIDTNFVDMASLVYMYVDPRYHTCGTYDEMSIARGEKTPVIAVVEGGKTVAPYWLIGRIGHKNIFGSHVEALEYIRKIMHGEIDFDHKSWLFLDVKER